MEGRIILHSPDNDESTTKMKIIVDLYVDIYLSSLWLIIVYDLP